MESLPLVRLKALDIVNLNLSALPIQHRPADLGLAAEQHGLLVILVVLRIVRRIGKGNIELVSVLEFVVVLLGDEPRLSHQVEVVTPHLLEPVRKRHELPCVTPALDPCDDLVCLFVGHARVTLVPGLLAEVLIGFLGVLGVEILTHLLGGDPSL